MRRRPTPEKKKPPKHPKPVGVQRATVIFDGNVPGRHELTVTFEPDPKR